jgi:hypothetical protein
VVDCKELTRETEPPQVAPGSPEEMQSNHLPLVCNCNPIRVATGHNQKSKLGSSTEDFEFGSNIQENLKTPDTSGL